MLYFVSTPIGNLKDISYRAVEVLSSADVIACEDTRTSLKLLNRYDIKKRLVAYHKFNEKTECEKIIAMIEEGLNVAVISDAGTPLVSDPGNALAEELHARGIPYTVVPGATAFTSALVLSGLDSDRFSFIGFLPEKKNEAEKLLAPYINLPSTLIFYSAPHDLKKTISRLCEILGDREAAIVKEITKIHEEVIRTTLCAAAEKYADGGLKGEIVLIIAGAKPEEKEQMTVEQAVEEAKKFIASGDSASEAAKKAAKLSGHKKGDIYKLLQGEKDNG